MFNKFSLKQDSPWILLIYHCNHFFLHSKVSLVNRNFLSLRLNFLPWRHLLLLFSWPHLLLLQGTRSINYTFFFKSFNNLPFIWLFPSAFKMCVFQSWKQFRPANQIHNQQARTSNCLLHPIVVFIFFHGPNSKMFWCLCLLFCITSFTANLTASLQHFINTFYLNFLLSEHSFGPWQFMLRKPQFSLQINCFWYLTWNYCVLNNPMFLCLEHSGGNHLFYANPHLISLTIFGKCKRNST